MKVGDIVMSTKIRPYDNAKVIRVDICRKLDEKKNRIETRTKYEAKYSDGTKLLFTGSMCNKSIFKVMQRDGQMCLEDFMNYPVEDEE